jgi:hypothetical protein
LAQVALGCVNDFLLEGSGVGQHWATTVSLDPVKNFRQEFVLLLDVLVSADVSQVNDRLGGKVNVGVQVFNFLNRPVSISNINSLF